MAHRFVVGSFEGMEASHVLIELHLAQITRVAGRESLRFGGRGTQVTTGEVLDLQVVHLVATNLLDEQGLGLDPLPHDRVVAGFNDIAEDFDLVVLIALPDDPALPLFEVSRPPGHIDVMLASQAWLHVRHLLSVAYGCRALSHRRLEWAVCDSFCRRVVIVGH